MNINERKTAADILLLIKTKKEAAAIAINNILKKHENLEKKSRAFITSLVYGTLENIYYIDYVIDLFSKTKTEKMRPQIAVTAELSVYQLLFMKNIPSFAVCSEAVLLTKKYKINGLTSFMNALLRNISRNIDTIKLPNKETETYKHLSCKYSLPIWLLKMWDRQYDSEKTEEIAKGLRSPKRLFALCNSNLISPDKLISVLEKEGVKAFNASKNHPLFLYLENIDSLQKSDAFKKGYFYIQDISCMLSALEYGLKKGDRVLDICAAPGGKSINAALSLSAKGGGLVESRDLTDTKINLIYENIKRLKLQNISLKKYDASVLDESINEAFDVVIADLPCSGLGIIGRKPDIILNISQQNIDELIKLQRKILQNAVTYLRSGGRLIFSTCTINKSENDDNSEFVIKNFPFKKIYEKQLMPNEIEGADGFYTAVFIKDYE